MRDHVKTKPSFRIILDNAYKDLAFDSSIGLFEVAPDLMPYGIELNSVAKFHGYAGRRGPGFAVSQNTHDIQSLKNIQSTALGIGDTAEKFLAEAFSNTIFNPEKSEDIIGMYRRRCRFVANYINEQLKPTESTNHEIALSPQGGMFVFADFKPWLGKKIDPKEARKIRKTLGETMPANKKYFSHAVFKNNTINDDKDLSIYLMFKAKVVTIPGQDFGIDAKDGMIRLALGDIGKLTNYNFNYTEVINSQPQLKSDPTTYFDPHRKKPEIEEFANYLPKEANFHLKPLDDLRKLKSAMNQIITCLKTLDKQNVRSH